ncbi:Chlorophyll A-B binding family protein [Forsythia ovata]|uniref:Chlorophyll A-B binding family protein n=1 Tax=Forsythia ovata TaxID=205694 RepID=A0ABD1X913_9LAMI
MASVGVTASIQRACNSQHITKIQPPQSRPARLKKATNVVTPNLDGLKLAENQEKSPFLAAETPKEAGDEFEHSNNAESSYPRFSDERWKNGMWDLNMFVKHGRMDWDAVIVAGRAAMVGFFMAYIVDALTGLDVVGQAGNFICKAALFVTIIGVILFRKTQDFEKIQKLAKEATFYDKQWQASWRNHDDPKD